MCATVNAAAQDSPQEEIVRQIRARWVASSEYTLAVAERMPADKYIFRPTPEQMTFGEQLLHIAEQNEMIVAEIQGLAPPEKKAIGRAKADILVRLKQTAALGLNLLQGEGGSRAPADVAALLNGMMLALDHTTHHRGQAIVYLRLNGMTPPEYRR